MKAPEVDHDDTDISPAHEEDKTGGWLLDQIEWCFHWKALKDLLSSDPVLMILKPKLIGSLRRPISAPIPTPNQLEAIRRLMELLQNDGFTTGAFDAKVLLECDHDRVIQEGRSPFSKLVPLTGECDPVDQAIQPIVYIPKGYHTIYVSGIRREVG
ncbi:unnamed protein product [Peronospora effusa]|nr:unnamed protein product [Peronospora effusa]